MSTRPLDGRVVAWWRALRAAPPAVLLLTALHLVGLASWSVLVPTYTAPDEPQHVDLVLALRDGVAYPGPTERAMAERVVASYGPARHAATEPPFARRTGWRDAGQAPPRGERPTFGELGGDAPTAQRNQMPQHPPLYYLLRGTDLRTAEALGLEATARPYDQQVGLLRLLDAAFVGILPLLAWAAAFRLGASRPAAVGAAVVPLAIPTLSHIGSTVNNDNLLTVLVGVLTVLLVHVATGDTRNATAGVTGLVAALALLTKGFALFAPAWIALAYLVAWRRERTAGAPARAEDQPSAVAAGALALALAVVGGGWWWVRNLLVHGALQPAGLDPTTPAPGFDTSVGAWVPYFASRLVRRFWGTFGWLEANLPEPLTFAAGAAVAALVVAAVVAGRRTGAGRDLQALLLVPTLGPLAIVAWGSLRAWQTQGSIGGIQGRYLFPGVVGLAVLVAMGAAAVARRAAPLVPLALMAGAAGLQLVAVRLVLARFWAPPAATWGQRVEALLAWAPWEPTVVRRLWLATAVVAVLAVGAVAAEAVTMAAGRPARQPTRQEGSPSPPRT